MADGNKLLSEILSKANPKTVNAIKQMAKSGQLDGLKSKLSKMDKDELLGNLKSFDQNSVENLLGKLDMGDLANNPSIKQIVNDISQNKKLQEDIKSVFKK